jgi:hypothetical protein
MELNATVGFEIVKTDNGHVVMFQGMSRPATNEEIAMWQILGDELGRKADRFNAMLESFATAMESKDFETAFEPSKSNSIFHMTMEVTRHRRRIGELESKLATALEYIDSVANAIKNLHFDELKEDDKEDSPTIYAFNSIQDLVTLRSIAERSSEEVEKLSFDLHQQLTDMRERYRVCSLLAEQIQAWAGADCKIILGQADN